MNDLSKPAKANEKECEWDFSKVQDAELVACCYWEYARESSFIRDVLQNLKDVSNGADTCKSSESANRDLTELYSIGTPADLFHRLPFPKSWQMLDEKDRKTGTDFQPKIPTPKQLPPFQPVNSETIAADLYGQTRKIYVEMTTIRRRLSELSSGVAGLKEAAKLREQLTTQEKSPPFVYVRGMGGVDSFIAQINWQDFTDKDIVAAFKSWVLKSRPAAAGSARLVGRRSDKGHKLNDWRVMLDRLSIMRLLHHATLSEMPKKFSAAWKQHSSADWYRERKNANRDFHRLFPFLAKSAFPLSWQTKGRHGRSTCNQSI